MSSKYLTRLASVNLAGGSVNFCSLIILSCFTISPISRFGNMFSVFSFSSFLLFSSFLSSVLFVSGAGAGAGAGVGAGAAGAADQP